MIFFNRGDFILRICLFFSWQNVDYNFILLYGNISLWSKLSSLSLFFFFSCFLIAFKKNLFVSLFLFLLCKTVGFFGVAVCRRFRRGARKGHIRLLGCSAGQLLLCGHRNSLPVKKDSLYNIASPEANLGRLLPIVSNPPFHVLVLNKRCSLCTSEWAPSFLQAYFCRQLFSKVWYR